MERHDLTGARALQASRDRHHHARANYSQPDFLLPLTTSTPGALRPGAPVGRLDAGHLANLLVWDTDHPAFWPGTQPLRTLAMGDTSHAIDRMMVAGRWLTADGQHHSLTHSPEYRDALTEAHARFDALTTRAGL